MHIAILIIAVLVVGGGIFVRNNKTPDSPKNQTVVEGATDPTSTQTPTIIPTVLIQFSPTSTISPSPTSSTSNTDFIYPGSTIGSQSQNSTVLTSSDDPNTITNWYKEKIKALGMSAQSFVTTKANDTVNNVLAAAKNDNEIKVTITKKSEESIVSITVER